MLRRLIGITKGLAAQFPARRSLRNVMWNMLGGVWAGILIVLVTPWYVSLLGIEGYGIVGLWLMMQVMMGIMDLGIGATLARELADSRRDPDRINYRRDLLRSLETVYWVISILVTLVLVGTAGWVGEYWLNAHTLPSHLIGDAISVMAIALGLQFPYTLYSQGLAGLQEHSRMNALHITGTTLRYGAGLGVLLWRGDLIWFFAVQALVATVQTFAARTVLWGMISGAMSSGLPSFRLQTLKQSWRFSLGMALTSVSAVLLANIDRIALSKMVPITELGKYAVAFTATGLLQLGIQPFYRTFFPRYAELAASGETKRLRNEYFRSCRLMGAVIIPFGIIGWLFAPQIITAWLGKLDKTIVDVFRWLLIGVTSSGLTWLPAAYQQAHGWTRLHVSMITGALVLGAPVMVLAIEAYGTVGATAVWVLHGVSDISLGLWLMHRRLLVGELLGWYRSVLLLPLLTGIPLGCISLWLMPQSLSRWDSLCWVAVTGIIVIAAAVFLGGIGKDSRAASAYINGE